MAGRDAPPYRGITLFDCRINSSEKQDAASSICVSAILPNLPFDLSDRYIAFAVSDGLASGFTQLDLSIRISRYLLMRLFKPL